MIDFHTHVLPGIDDGSANLEESLAMLRQEVAQGITCVVATPHFYANHDTPEHFLAQRRLAEAQLRKAMATESGLPELIVGAEVYFFRGMSESDSLRRLTIGRRRYILIEMPPAPWSEDIYRELLAIREKQGITPVIAHINRYIGPLRTYRIPQRLEKLPVLVQSNSSFFLDKSTAGMAMRMLKANQIHLLGSDCHNITTRPPNMRAAVQHIHQKLGRDVLVRIRSNERKILGV